MLREGIEERRSKPRIEGPFPATLRGRTASGESFELDTRLANLSVNGFYVCLNYSIAVASRVHTIIHLPGMEVQANGIVRRIEARHDGTFGFGVALEKYRIRSAPLRAPRREGQANGSGTSILPEAGLRIDPPGFGADPHPESGHFPLWPGHAVRFLWGMWKMEATVKPLILVILVGCFKSNLCCYSQQKVRHLYEYGNI